MGIPKVEKYNQEKIEKLRKYLNTYAERGQSLDYEIRVDDFSAVRRTDDPSLFEQFADFVAGDTKCIEIIFYQPNNNYDKYIFNLQEEQKKEALSGLEVENKVMEHVNKAKQEWEHEQTKKECQEWKEYAEELEEDVEKLEKELLEIRDNQSPMQGILGEFGASLISGMVKQNPKFLQKIPALSGLVEAQGSKVEKDAEPDFHPSKEAEENPEAKEALKFVNYLKAKFTEEQFSQVMSMLEKLTEKPEKIEGVITYINS